jgi:acyl-CoA thioesterase-2
VDREPDKAVADLLNILDLERIEVNIFRGYCPDEERQRVFGGQVMAQSLVAAQRTVENGSLAHSLHGYFLRPGDPNAPILYDVDRIRDGRSFTTRRVVAIQHGRAIFNMAASFQIDEGGAVYQMTLPEVPDPDELTPWSDYLGSILDELPAEAKAWYGRPRPIETRPAKLFHPLEATIEDPPRQFIWFRTAAPVTDDPALHQALALYAVDMWLLDCSVLAHGFRFGDPNFQGASLDHAMWFQRPFRADDWLLLDAECISTGGARGLNRSNIFTRDGRLVASANQEGLIRMRGGGADSPPA